MFPDPATGKPLQLTLTTQTYDFEAGDARPIGRHQVLSYGGNIRRNNFDITLAPNAQDRNEIGGYMQDEIILEQVPLRHRRPRGQVRQPRRSRLLAAPGGAVQGPAGALGAIRLQSRVPIAVRDQQLSRSEHRCAPGLERPRADSPPPLRPLVANPFPLVVRAVGSELPIGSTPQPKLTEESVTAYEIAYTGTIKKRSTVGFAFYVNDLNDSINFVQLPSNLDPYTAANPPPGWPLPPSS